MRRRAAGAFLPGKMLLYEENAPEPESLPSAGPSAAR
jgi:hypothetical protein